jgi:hypothetical protein
LFDRLFFVCFALFNFVHVAQWKKQQQLLTSTAPANSQLQQSDCMLKDSFIPSKEQCRAAPTLPTPFGLTA